MKLMFYGLAVLICMMVPGASAPVGAQELTVFADGPVRPALEPISEAFTRESGIALKLSFAPSPVLMKRLTSGEKADVLITQPVHIAHLATSKMVASDQAPIVARIGVGLAARAGSAASPLDKVTDLLSVLEAADAILINNVASGNQFVDALQKNGMASKLSDKIVRLGPSELPERLAASDGKVIGVGTTSLIKADPRLVLISELPEAMQSYVELAAVRLSQANMPSAADRFVAYLQSPAARSVFATIGSR